MKWNENFLFFFFLSFSECSADHMVSEMINWQTSIRSVPLVSSTAKLCLQALSANQMIFHMNHPRNQVSPSSFFQTWFSSWTDLEQIVFLIQSSSAADQAPIWYVLCSKFESSVRLQSLVHQLRQIACEPLQIKVLLFKLL